MKIVNRIQKLIIFLIDLSASLLICISLPAQLLPNRGISSIETTPQFYIDRLGSVNINNVSRTVFHDFSRYFKEIPQFLPVNKSIWIKYAVAPLRSDTVIFFYSGQQHYIEAYIEKKGKIYIIGKTGSFVPASQLSIPENRVAVKISIDGGTSSIIYIRIYNYSAYHVDPFTPTLVSRREDLSDYISLSRQIHSSSDILYAFCLGMFLIMFLYVFIKFIYIRDNAYLWYALSIFVSFAYFLLNYLQRPFHDYLFSENPFLLPLISDPLLIIGIICCQLFFLEFLHIKQNDRLLYRLLSWEVTVIFFYAGLAVLYVYLTKDLNARILANQFLVTLGGFFTVFGLHRIYKIKTRLSKFLLAGIVCMTVFYFSSLIARIVIEHLNLDDPTGGILHLDLLLTGNLSGILFFTLALGYRERREIILKNQFLEQERAEKMKVDFNRKILESEMKVLHAQLKPHFFFNCLSTIESYILQARSQKASKLLQKFAVLTRLILENSVMSYITVAKELEALLVYVELEGERSDDQFTYTIEVDDQSTLELLIPPMLLQPLVENAIFHGLRHLPGKKGILKISARKENNYLIMSIEDNGIGLKAAQKIKAHGGLTTTSSDILIVKERLALIWNVTEVNRFFRIVDKTPPSGGVLVEIYFPKRENV